MLKQVREAFQKQLHHLYDRKEIDELFFLCVEDILSLRKSQVLMNMTKELNAGESTRFQDILSALLTGKPIQYVLGVAWFYGSRFEVNQDVLIPRPETEELVKLIIESNTSPDARVLDIGTGSGCIAISLKKNIPAAEVYAWDISEGALRVARRNADLNQVKVSFRHVDILSEIKSEDTIFDIIVSNPPYITSVERHEMHENVLRFEPSIALFVPDEQPLLFYKAIASYAKGHLMPKGRLFFEINRSYAADLNAMLLEEGFHAIQVHQDMQGNDRMISARVSM